MPRYYQYGFQRPRYQANWKGYPVQSTRSPMARALGDVTDVSHRINLKPSGDPYLLHKRNFDKPFHFSVPKLDDPYYTHKYVWPMGALTPSRTEGQALKIGAAALVAYFLLLKKGAPLRRKLEKVIK